MELGIRLDVSSMCIHMYIRVYIHICICISGHACIFAHDNLHKYQLNSHWVKEGSTMTLS